MSDPTDLQAALRRFTPKHRFFVGIDSDGCAFDSMELKWKECFIPALIRDFGLAAISRCARETSEFINLYSRHRGTNRFPSLILTLDLLKERPEALKRGVDIPRLEGLRQWLSRETKLSNAVLKVEVEANGDPNLKRTLAWSLAVNQAIEEIVRDVPPFPYVRESLVEIGKQADIMVVSATPGEALEREWRENGLTDLVAVIAGQEMGSKSQVLRVAAAGKYDNNHILMIGDAPGDLAAAESVGVLFYPIEPGHEEESWKWLLDEGLARFFAGTYAGDSMNDRVKRFQALLPDEPPWKTSRSIQD